MIASTIANTNRDPKRRSQPFKPSDFMPTPPKPQTPAEQKAMLRALTAGIEQRLA